MTRLASQGQKKPHRNRRYELLRVTQYFIFYPEQGKFELSRCLISALKRLFVRNYCRSIDILMILLWPF